MRVRSKGPENVEERRFRHGRATRGGRVFILPNVQKDARTPARNGRIMIVFDHESPFVANVRQNHVLCAFPIAVGDLPRVDELIVMTRLRVIDCHDISRERKIWPGFKGSSLSISESCAKIENAGWRAVVAFDFFRAVELFFVHQAAAPGHPGPAQPNRQALALQPPRSFRVTRKQLQFAKSGVPGRGSDDKTLATVIGKMIHGGGADLH